MPVQSLRGEKFYLVEVIAFILKQLKDSFLDRLHTLQLKDSRPPSPEDIHWVITVPAIWKPEGKQLMREAAYLVCTECYNIHKLGYTMTC